MSRLTNVSAPLSTCGKLFEHNKINSECMESLLEYQPKIAEYLRGLFIQE